MAKELCLAIRGMTCQACAHRLERVLNKQDFVQLAEVSFAGESARIVLRDETVAVDEVLAVVDRAGFQAALPMDSLSEADDVHLPYRVWALLVLALPFAVGMLGMLFGIHGAMPSVAVQVVLAAVAQGYFAIPFYRGAVASIRAGVANMDVLVSLGTLAIFVYSLVRVGKGSHEVYFEAGVMVLAFVSLGKYWEERTKRGSLNALGALLQLTPQTVLVAQQQQWRLMPIQEVQTGDIVRCVSGGRIAADGEVVAGEGWADERHLTGESMAVHKQVGDRVLAGSLISGSVDYRATHLGRATVLGDMMAALAEAQSSKAPIARLADRVVAVFVPMVLALSALTFVVNVYGHDVSVAMMRAVAVLVVACPCALGLATPAAVMAGLGVAVRHGVWFKNAAVLEHSHAVNTIVLDKTGTLTQGKPDVVALWHTSDMSESVLWRVAAAVAQHSHHPLARAIWAAAMQRDIVPYIASHRQTIAGAGVCADIAEIGEIKMGNAAFCGLRLPEETMNHAIWHTASMVAFAVNGQAVGAFALADALKPDSFATVQRLREQGIAVYLVSGDRLASVAHIAEQLHLSPDHAHGEHTPRQKTEFIQQLKQTGAIVGMVGDGMNDAPALAMADVGFAVYGSTDVAEYSADAVLMRPSLQQLADGLLIARVTVRTIRQNLFFAFIYNVLGIPLAAMGYLTPMWAGAMMAMSSLSVLLNALRLTRWQVR